MSRQVVPAGDPAAANLVQALDEPLQEGTLDLQALAPVARLMSVGRNSPPVRPAVRAVSLAAAPAALE